MGSCPAIRGTTLLSGTPGAFERMQGAEGNDNTLAQEKQAGSRACSPPLTSPARRNGTPPEMRRMSSGNGLEARAGPRGAGGFSRRSGKGSPPRTRRTRMLQELVHPQAVGVKARSSEKLRFPGPFRKLQVVQRRVRGDPYTRAPTPSGFRMRPISRQGLVELVPAHML